MYGYGMTDKRDITILMNSSYAADVINTFSMAFGSVDKARKALSYLITQGHVDRMIYTVAHGYKTQYGTQDKSAEKIEEFNRFKVNRRAKIRRQQVNNLLRGISYPKRFYLDIGCETLVEPENYAQTLGINKQNMKCININDWVGAYEENVHGNIVNKDSRFSFYDGVNIPMHDSTVSVVTLNMVLHHVESYKKDQLLQNVRRVLEPGGILIIREHDSYDMALDRGKPKEEFDMYLDFIHHHYDSVSNIDFRWVDDYETTYQSRDELNSMLEAQGFESKNVITHKRPDRVYQEVFKVVK